MTSQRKYPRRSDGNPELSPPALSMSSRSANATSPVKQEQNTPLFPKLKAICVCVHREKKMGRGRPRKCKICSAACATSPVKQETPLFPKLRPICVHREKKGGRGRPRKCEICFNSCDSNLMCKNENILEGSMETQALNAGQGVPLREFIRVAGPGSNIFEMEDDLASEAKKSLERKMPSVLFPYRNDAGNFMIVDDYNCIDGVLVVPLEKIKEFDSRLDNCEPLVSEIMRAYLTEGIHPDHGTTLAISNTSTFIDYLNEQSSIIMNIMDEVLPDVNINYMDTILHPTVHIKIVEMKATAGISAYFNITRTQVIQEVLVLYCQDFLKNPVSKYCFLYKCRLVKISDTANSLDLKNGDTIQCLHSSFLKLYTVKFLVPYMERMGITALSGSFIEDLLSSFSDGLKGIKNKGKEREYLTRRVHRDVIQLSNMLNFDDLNERTSRFLSISRRRQS